MIDVVNIVTERSGLKKNIIKINKKGMENSI